ncbi:MAG: EutN/CcmL family microcompartment protein [Deltaproteobacteria bacterium]|nr:EutN/CcmL family microcompartment protein [Deltaproteobacteria bacterium]
MFVGRVVGTVWATVKWPELEGLKFLTVRPHHVSDLVAGDGDRLPACHDLVVCADVLGAGVGEDVVVAYGHAGRVALHEVLGQDDLTAYPIDAAVVAIVDRMEVQRSDP